MKIETAQKSDFMVLIDIWEASVRATHHFLNEEDILRLKPLILEQYFDAVDLRLAKNESGQIIGFCGVHDGSIEMLFIAPKVRGCGVGKALATDAIVNQGVTKVDVNEQNNQARGFYEHLNFKVVGRSATDGEGKPYPILHMSL